MPRLVKITSLFFLMVFMGVLMVGCSETETVDSTAKKIELTVYMNGTDNGGVALPSVPVKREITLTDDDTTEFRVKAAIEQLIKGPTEKEKEDGLSTAMPEDVKVLNVDFNRPYVTVNFSTELQYIGGTMMVGSLLEQIKYTLTELDGVAGIILQVNGEQVGTEASPFSGDGFQFNVLSRTIDGTWVKKISPARTLDNFIVSIGSGEAREMWQWMGPGAKEHYQSPEEVNVTDFSEGLGQWRGYEIVSEDIEGDKAVVVIKGDQVLEGMVEKDATYTAYMVKEDGQWKWDPWSKNK